MIDKYISYYFFSTSMFLLSALFYRTDHDEVVDISQCAGGNNALYIRRFAPLCNQERCCRTEQTEGTTLPERQLPDDACTQRTMESEDLPTIDT